MVNDKSRSAINSGTNKTKKAINRKKLSVVLKELGIIVIKSCNKKTDVKAGRRQEGFHSLRRCLE
jgi:uncharacterized protein (UPF0212 family)